MMDDETPDHAFAERTARYGRLETSTDPLSVSLLRLQALDDHLLGIGDVEGAADARARWLDEVIAFGITPANDREQAAAKVELLRRSVSSRLVEAAVLKRRRDALAGVIAVITGPASAEAERWYLPESSIESSETSATDAETALAPFELGSDTRATDVLKAASLSEPLTFESARRQVAMMEQDVLALSRMARHEVAEAARSELSLAIFKMVATQVLSVGDLKAKQAILCRHVELCEPAWLVDRIIGATLMEKYRALELSSVDEARLRRMPPREAA